MIVLAAYIDDLCRYAQLFTCTSDAIKKQQGQEGGKDGKVHHGHEPTSADFTDHFGLRVWTCDSAGQIVTLFFHPLSRSRSRSLHLSVYAARDAQRRMSSTAARDAPHVMHKGRCQSTQLVFLLSHPRLPLVASSFPSCQMSARFPLVTSVDLPLACQQTRQRGVSSPDTGIGMCSMARLTGALVLVVCVLVRAPTGQARGRVRVSARASTHAIACLSATGKCIQLSSR